MTTDTLVQQLKDAQHVVVLTGAGASAERGALYCPWLRQSMVH